MRIIVAGPQEEIENYQTWLTTDLSAEVAMCHEPSELGRLLKKGQWQVVILDCQDGVFQPQNLQMTIREVSGEIPVVVISGGSSADALGVFRLGVSDFLVPPVERKDLVRCVNRLYNGKHGSRIARDTETPSADTDGERLIPDDALFGGSSKMQNLKQVVDKVLDADLPVLITGESGTGKEMIARYIWSNSKRHGPFVKVNCAAIPSELLESELFGFERGAFTGAYRRKPGKFEAADNGFLFLDEISDLSYPLQSKLLHVLQDGSFSALGSNREVSVNVRIIAATNRNLEECVRKGTFRDDLFFRLNVVRLHLPALRERLDQMASLVDYFIRRFAAQYGAKPIKLTTESHSFLYTYPWPGNIRELENVIRRATVLGGDSFLAQEKLAFEKSNGQNGGTSETGPEVTSPQDVAGSNDPGTQAPKTTEGNLSLREIARRAALAAEKEVIKKVLQQTRWNRKKTAKILDVSYKTLLTKIKETGLDEN